MNKKDLKVFFKNYLYEPFIDHKIHTKQPTKINTKRHTKPNAGGIKM